MRTTIVLMLGTGLALSGCATRREVLAADRYDARVQTRQCQNAKVNRGRRAQAVQCAQARDARQQLRADRASPY
jgi:hypothetical protein